MVPDWLDLSRALGVSENALRILLGIPTRLQKAVRAADDFASICRLADAFSSDLYRSCGPRFEPEEKTEYDAKRAELFAKHLESHTTIESFESFGYTRTGDYILTPEEAELASERFGTLVMPLIEETAEAEDSFTKLLALRKLLRKNHGGADRGLLTIRVEDKIKWQFQREFSKARKEGLQAMIDLTKRVRGIMSMSDTRLQCGNQTSYPWSGLWEDAKTVGELLHVKAELPEGFLPGNSADGFAFETRLASLAKAETEARASWSDAAEYARSLVRLDSYHPSCAYSAALRAVGAKATSKDEILTTITLWKARGRTRNNEDYPRVPHELLDKWDALFLSEAQNEADVAKLVTLIQASPERSATRSLAEMKLSAHFQSRVDVAMNSAEILAVKIETEKLPIHVSIRTYEREDALRAAEHARNLEERWIAVRRSDFEGDRREALIGLFHAFHKSNSERAKEVLRLIVSFFPAEEMDSVEV